MKQGRISKFVWTYIRISIGTSLIVSGILYLIIGKNIMNLAYNPILNLCVGLPTGLLVVFLVTKIIFRDSYAIDELMARNIIKWSLIWCIIMIMSSIGSALLSGGTVKAFSKMEKEIADYKTQIEYREKTGHITSEDKEYINKINKQVEELEKQIGDMKKQMSPINRTLNAIFVPMQHLIVWVFLRKRVLAVL